MCRLPFDASASSPAEFRPTRTLDDLLAMQNDAAGKKLALEVRRKQQTMPVDVADYVFVLTDGKLAPN